MAASRDRFDGSTVPGALTMGEGRRDDTPAPGKRWLAWVLLAALMGGALFASPSLAAAGPAPLDPELFRAAALSREAEQLKGAKRFDEAIPLARRAMAAWEKVVGKGHPRFAVSINEL